MRMLALLVFLLAALGASIARAGGYDDVRIVEPVPEATLHDNLGNVQVRVAVVPALRAGDRVEVLLDGKPAAAGAALRFELRGVERGTHTLQARVLAGDGKALKGSPPVTFHLWQASRLFPGRRD